VKTPSRKRAASVRRCVYRTPPPLRSTPTPSKLPYVPIACSSPSRSLWAQVAARRTSTFLGATHLRVSVWATRDLRPHPARRHSEAPRGLCQLTRESRTTRERHRLVRDPDLTRTLPIRVTDARSIDHRRAPHRSRRATPDSSTQFHPSTACRARGFRGEFRKPFSAGIRRTGERALLRCVLVSDFVYGPHLCTLRPGSSTRRASSAIRGRQGRSGRVIRHVFTAGQYMVPAAAPAACAAALSSAQLARCRCREASWHAGGSRHRPSTHLS